MGDRSRSGSGDACLSGGGRGDCREVSTREAGNPIGAASRGERRNQPTRGALGPEMAEDHGALGGGTRPARRLSACIVRAPTDRCRSLVYTHGGGWVWGSVGIPAIRPRGRSPRQARSLSSCGLCAVTRGEIRPGTRGMRRRDAACRARRVRPGASIRHASCSAVIGQAATLLSRRHCCCVTGGGPKISRHRHRLPGVRQPVRHTELSGIRHRPRADAREDGVLLERLPARMKRRPLASARSALARRPDRPAAGADPARRAQCPSLGGRGARGEATGSRRAGGARNLSGRAARFPARY